MDLVTSVARSVLKHFDLFHRFSPMYFEQSPRTASIRNGGTTDAASTSGGPRLLSAASPDACYRREAVLLGVDGVTDFDTRRL
jgi:hypothetical protein